MNESLVCLFAEREICETAGQFAQFFTDRPISIPGMYQSDTYAMQIFPPPPYKLHFSLNLHGIFHFIY